MRGKAASYPDYYQGGRVKAMTIDADLGKFVKPIIDKSPNEYDRMDRHEPIKNGLKDGQDIEDVKHDKNIDIDDGKEQESHNIVHEPDNSKVKDPRIEALINNIINGPDTSDTNHSKEISTPSMVDELNSTPFDVEQNQHGSESEEDEESHTTKDESKDGDEAGKDMNDTGVIGTNDTIQNSSIDPKMDYNDRDKEDYRMEPQNISSIIDKHKDNLAKVKDDTDLQVKSQNQVRNKSETKKAEKQIDHIVNHITRYNKAFSDKNAPIDDHKNDEDHDMNMQNITPDELKERLSCQQSNLMKVYELNIPADKGLTDFALLRCIDSLKVPEFRGIFMLDELPNRINPVECGIVNIIPSEKLEPHWICYAKIFNKSRICFDSFCGETPSELQKYLKTSQEFRNCTPVIERNCVQVQRIGTSMTGHLCLFVLTSLMREHFTFQQVVDQLRYGFSVALW